MLSTGDRWLHVHPLAKSLHDNNAIHSVTTSCSPFETFEDLYCGSGPLRPLGLLANSSSCLESKESGPQYP